MKNEWCKIFRVFTNVKSLELKNPIQNSLLPIGLSRSLRFKNVTKPKLTCSKNQLYSKDYITKQHNSSLQNCISCSQLAILILNSCFYLIQQISRFHPFSAGKNLDNFFIPLYNIFSARKNRLNNSFTMIQRLTFLTRKMLH
ncbi:hypothetical protein T07_8988 [Trichinella nelsoni]|uniref:Uncharacterized protein n=1 Tax=Trichinella nelsoni TaxID=6336 RepID=A0A0V0SMS9_9BILA|nr:hypothetical protein T07_8988 [Trichinella nelsoni]